MSEEQEFPGFLKIECFTKFECPHCFYVWQEPSTSDAMYPDFHQKSCQWCVENACPHISSMPLLIRRLEVLETSFVKRFPVVVKQVFEVLLKCIQNVEDSK